MSVALHDVIAALLMPNGILPLTGWRRPLTGQAINPSSEDHEGRLMHSGIAEC
jgi:hypothetical protein